jgi:hypothetical protein
MTSPDREFTRVVAIPARRDRPCHRADRRSPAAGHGGRLAVPQPAGSETRADRRGPAELRQGAPPPRGGCVNGTSNANDGSSAQFGMGLPNHCGNLTPIGQEAKLYQVAEGGVDLVIARANATASPRNCGILCTAPKIMTLAPVSSGCGCVRNRQYYSFYGVGGYVSCDGSTCALVGLYEVTKQSARTIAP